MFIKRPKREILCRGKSLLDIQYFEKYFHKCLVVNDFKNEIYHFRDILKKRDYSFVNRLSTPILNKTTYEEFNIRT